jgi:hypothetical protein
MNRDGMVLGVAASPDPSLPPIEAPKKTAMARWTRRKIDLLRCSIFSARRAEVSHALPVDCHVCDRE